MVEGEPEISRFGIDRFDGKPVADAACFGHRLLHEDVAGVAAEGNQAAAVRALRLIAVAQVRYFFAKVRPATAALNPDFIGYHDRMMRRLELMLS